MHSDSPSWNFTWKAREEEEEEEAAGAEVGQMQGEEEQCAGAVREPGYESAGAGREELSLS